MKNLLKFDFRGYAWYLTRKYKNKILSKFTTFFMYFLCFLKGVKIGKRVKFKGFMQIRRHPESFISIGDNNRYNSAKRSVQIPLTKPCALVTLQKKAQIILGKNIGGTSFIVASAKSIKIGDNVLLGANCFIMDTDWHNSDPDHRDSINASFREVVIGDNVFIGYQTIVLKGVTIGANSIIGANSVVTSNIPENSIAMGNPCKIIMKRTW